MKTHKGKKVVEEREAFQGDPGFVMDKPGQRFVTYHDGKQAVVHESDLKEEPDKVERQPAKASDSKAEKESTERVRAKSTPASSRRSPARVVKKK